MFINKKILIVAPHLIFPPGKGADILIDNRIKFLVKNLKTVHLLSYKNHIVFNEGQKISKNSYNNKQRSLIYASIRALFSTRTYLYEKLITPAYLKQIKKIVECNEFDIYYYSFIFSAISFNSIDGKTDSTIKIIEMHNDDIEWYSNLKNKSFNPFLRIVASVSIKSTRNFLLTQGKNYKFIALTQKDAQGYNTYIPEENIIIIPAGIDTVRIGKKFISKDIEKIKLLFIGSLDVKINYDALLNFAKNYLPALKEKFGDALKIKIAGRRPTAKVRHLCSKHNWELYPNLTNSDLQELLLESHFTIMPFEYTTGAKMKLLESLAHGIPILATNAIKGQIQLEPYSRNYIFSDSADEWCEFIDNHINEGFKNLDHSLFKQISAHYSWDRVNKALLEIINT